MVIQRSCSSLRVSVKRVSPALAPAIIPALDTFNKLSEKKSIVIMGVSNSYSSSYRNTYQGIGQGGFAMIDVSNDGHVTDVPLLVHQSTDFIDGEVDLWTPKEKKKTHRLVTQHFQFQFHNNVKERSQRNFPRPCICRFCCNTFHVISHFLIVSINFNTQSVIMWLCHGVSDDSEETSSLQRHHTEHLFFCNTIHTSDWHHPQKFLQHSTLFLVDFTLYT